MQARRPLEPLLSTIAMSIPTVFLTNIRDPSIVFLFAESITRSVSDERTTIAQHYSYVEQQPFHQSAVQALLSPPAYFL